MQTKRCFNSQYDTIDFAGNENGVVFRTVKNEPVVFQMGTCNASNALLAAQVVCNDVRAVDINMGCPCLFSLQGGMGSDLLKNPQLIHDILTTLTRNLTLPVTCKIRLLEDTKATIDLCKMIADCGVSAIGIHARHIGDRPRVCALSEEVPLIVQSLHNRVPVLYNGDVFMREDIEQKKKLTGAASIMIARGALWNCSLFRKEGMLPLFDVMNQYISISEKYDLSFPNVKYTLLEMLKNDYGPRVLFQQVTRSKSMDAVKTILQNAVKTEPSLTQSYQAHFKFSPRPNKPSTLNTKKRKSEDSISVLLSSSSSSLSNTISLSTSFSSSALSSSTSISNSSLSSASASTSCSSSASLASSVSSSLSVSVSSSSCTQSSFCNCSSSASTSSAFSLPPRPSNSRKKKLCRA